MGLRLGLGLLGLVQIALSPQAVNRESLLVRIPQPGPGRILNRIVIRSIYRKRFAILIPDMPSDGLPSVTQLTSRDQGIIARRAHAVVSILAGWRVVQRALWTSGVSTGTLIGKANFVRPGASIVEDRLRTVALS